MNQVPRNPDDNEFIDNEALADLAEKIVDHSRSIGLTIDPNDIQFTVHPKMGMMAMIPALVRPSAKSKMDEDKVSREAFNVLMAKNAEAKVEEMASQIVEMVDSDDFVELFFGDAAISDCEHTNMHPSGFCLECRRGMEE